jgi:hypothetical protein
MDLGIMDAYSDELMDLYEAMKNPAQCMEDIMNMAALYDCDVVAITASDRVLPEYGSYHLAKTTESYMIYVRS